MKVHLLKICGTLTAGFFVASPLQAAITDTAATGFEIEETAHVAVPPERVYDLVIQPARWWSSEHTYSGSAANLSLEARAGGCWCERLADGGSVQHMVVSLVIPGKTVVLHGGLGPLLNQALSGAMIWSLKPAAGGGTDLTLTYRVAGYMKDGFGTLPKAVDGVLGQQVESLRRVAEAAK